jgi:hypothetical protein
MTALVGCALVPIGVGSTGGLYPTACSSLGFGVRQCAAIVDSAVGEPATLPADTAVLIRPPGPGQGLSLGSHAIATVIEVAPDGTETLHEVRCMNVGSPDDLACSADARIFVVDGVDRDVPCTGPAADGCATLPPTPGPLARSVGRALAIPAIDILLDHTGRYEIEVGSAALPNGYLLRRSMALADPRPTAFWIRGGVTLDVRSTIAGRPPIGNAYRVPYAGVEPVHVFVVFDVTEITGRAVLEIRDLVVG